MAKGQKTGGRQKGSVNKTTSAVKEALKAAFDQLGGVDSLVGWAKQNETEFYKLWAKLLPQEVNLTGAVAITHEESLEQLDKEDDAQGTGDTPPAA